MGGARAKGVPRGLANGGEEMARHRRRGAQPQRWRLPPAVYAVPALGSLLVTHADKACMLANQVASALNAMSWRAHVYFASTIELVPALVLAARSLRDLR